MQRITNNKRQSGATVVEYALIVAFVAMAVVVTVILLGQRLDSNYQGVKDCVQNIQTQGPSACE